jgi:small-conductance mechanosensitive channel
MKVLCLPLLLCAFILYSLPIHPQPAQTQNQIATLEIETGAEPATLFFQNREIFTLRATISGKKPTQRVETALQRLNALPDFALKEKIQTRRIAEGLLLSVGTNYIFGIIPQDLDPSLSETPEQAANRAASNLAVALDAKWRQKNTGVLLRGILFAVLATLVFLFILFLLFRLRAKLFTYFSQKTHTAEKLKVFGFDLRNALRVMVQVALRFVLLALLLITAYGWLSFTLRQFPYTYPWGVALRSFFWGSVRDLAVGFVNAIPSLFTVVVIFVIVRLITKLVKKVFQEIESQHLSLPGIHPETSGATRRLVNALLWMFAIVVAYPYIPGSNTDAFKGISVFVGLMFTLGSAGILNHLMSGLVLVYSRALTKGDYVAVGDIEGFVNEVGPLSVKIATLDRREVTIPNTVMTNTNIINYTRISKDKGLILRATVTIGYDAPWRQVHAMLKLAASRTGGLRKDAEPYVLQTALSDFYVEYKLCVPLERAEERIVRLSELHANIQDAFNEYGVQILSPHFEAQPENNVVVPKSKWFPEPAMKPKED